MKTLFWLVMVVAAAWGVLDAYAVFNVVPAHGQPTPHYHMAPSLPAGLGVQQDPKPELPY